MSLLFFYDDTSFVLPSPDSTLAWLTSSIEKEGATRLQISCVFCSDKVVHGLNKRYLNHDTYTDVLTFDYTPKGEKDALEGDIFISVDRVQENAKSFNTPFKRELHRVLIHGALHLLGYRDKEPAERAIMREKEEIYLSLLP